MIKKILLRVGLVFISIVFIYLVIVSFLSVYYKKEIETYVISAINDKIKKPVQVKKISISPFTDFPYISLSLNDVSIPKADSSVMPLLKVKKFQLLIGVHHLLFNNFRITEATFSDGSLDARVDSLGRKDFDIFLPKDTAGSHDPIFNSIKAEKIKLKNIELFYEDLNKSKCVHLYFKNTTTALKVDSAAIKGDLHGIIYSDEVTLRPGTLFDKSELLVHFFLKYDLNTKVFYFNQSSLQSGENTFLANGRIEFLNNNLFSLNVKTRQTDIREIFRLIPSRWTKSLVPLHLNGSINADADIKINLSPGHQPNFNIKFSGDKFSVDNEYLHIDIHDLTFKGALTSTDKPEVENYILSFSELKGHINKDDSLQARNVSFSNFIDPVLKTNIHLTLRCKTLLDIVNFKKYSKVGGRVRLEANYNGKFNYLFGLSDETPQVNGTIKLHHVNLKLNKVFFTFNDIDGKVEFRNDLLEMKNLNVLCGKSDMKIRGTAKNLFNAVFNDTTGLEMNIQFTSDKFYFCDFACTEPEGNGKRNIHIVENSRFVLPYDMKASLVGRTSHFFARNYHAKDIELEMKLDAKNVRVVEVLTSFGGTMSSVTDFIPIKNSIHCNTDVRIKNFQVDKIFSSFDNFKQELLKSDNIKGIVNARFDTYFRMNPALEVDSSSVYVKGDYEINKLELINVEPLLKLTKVGFKEEDLQHVTFNQIKSSISIKDDVINIPRTLYVTNILYFYIDGTIQPDGDTEFKILLPVKNLIKKKKRDTSKLTNDSKAGLSIPIRLKGKAGKLKVL